MKRFVSIFMTLAMILSLGISVFADTSATYTLTITGAAGHVYNIYQIYTGDVSNEVNGKGETVTVLSNVKYGVNHYPVDGEVGDPVPSDELTSLTSTSTQIAIDRLRSAVKDAPYRAGVSPEENESSIGIEKLPAGYYMIVDVTDETGEQTKSPIMLQVVETVTVASKHASIVSEKKVDDKNDSNTGEDGVNWQDSADYDIGDAVPFQLSATIPSTYNTYEDYTITFHDKQADGFEDPIIDKVYILKKDGTKIDIGNVESSDGTSGYKRLKCNSEKCEFGGCSFTVEVGDINDLYGTNSFAEGDKIIVEYTAELNDDANIGKTGNENGMYVCHPDGHTPKDYVIVFTYEFKGNKIDGVTKESLEGAGFTLYKWSHAEDKWIAVSEEIKGGGITSFTWSGIDDGKYKLEETTTPTGYNTMASLEFVVTADHKTSWTTGGNSAFEDVIAKDPVDDTKIIFADAKDNEEDGKLEGTLENYKGTVLPETGAGGTMLLIGGGAMFVLIAAVFMITRKKMSVYED